MSICLGRPFAARDEDCRCSLPANLRDEQYLAFVTDQPGPSNLNSSKHTGDKPLTGFLAFARLCRIAGKCESLNSPSRTRILASTNPQKLRRYVAKARRCEKVLENWLANLSDDFRFSANAVDNDHPQTPELTMCVIAFIMHAGLLLNMYRYVAVHGNFTIMILIRSTGVYLSRIHEHSLKTKKTIPKP
jgi:hypothetical protein